MIKHLNKRTLSTLLQGPLPGKAGQEKLAPESRILDQATPGGIDNESKNNVDPGIDIGNDCRAAAVMVLLYSAEGLLHTVFMKRNEYDGPHSGQISFPGGIYEDEDNDLMKTALRETEEEIGIDQSKIDVVGRLTPLFIPVSNFCVTPYVGWLDEKPVFNPDSSEVQYILTPTLEELIDPSNRCKETLHRHGRDILTPYILLDEDILWGATAMILSEFMELIDR